MATIVEGMHINEIAINPFKMHLADALLATHYAQSATSDHPKVKRAGEAMLCRSAVAHSVFAFESAANCFLDQVPRTKEFRENAELWPALDKFDLFLLSVPGSPKIPRDDPRIKAMLELIKIRDRHVHPRVVTLPVRRTETADISIRWKLASKSLRMVPLGFAWSPTEAVLAINTVLDFLRLFVSLTALPPQRIRAILSDVVKCKDGLRLADTGDFNAILKIGSSVGVDVGFLINDS